MITCCSYQLYHLFGKLCAYWLVLILLLYVLTISKFQYWVLYFIVLSLHSYLHYCYFPSSMTFFHLHFPQIWWVYRFNKKINVYLPRVLYTCRITRKLLKLEMIGHGPLQATYTAMFNTAPILFTLIFVLWLVE